MDPLKSYPVELRPRQYVFPLVMAMMKASGIRGHYDVGNLIMSYLPAPLLPALRSLYPDRIGASLIDIMLKVPIDTDTQLLIQRRFSVLDFTIISSMYWLQLDMEAIFKSQAWQCHLLPGYDGESFWDLDALEWNILFYIKNVWRLHQRGLIKLQDCEVRGGSMFAILQKLSA
jgi:hypothetical protein